MGRRSRDAGADTSRCTRAEILTDTGAASHRNLAFTALVQVSRPCLLAFLAWVVEHRPAQGPSLQLAPGRCPFRLTNSRLELIQRSTISATSPVRRYNWNFPHSHQTRMNRHRPGKAAGRKYDLVRAQAQCWRQAG